MKLGLLFTLLAGLAEQLLRLAGDAVLREAMRALRQEDRTQGLGGIAGGAVIAASRRVNKDLTVEVLLDVQ